MVWLIAIYCPCCGYELWVADKGIRICYGCALMFRTQGGGLHGLIEIEPHFDIYNHPDDDPGHPDWPGID